MYLVLPATIAMGPISTLVALYILSLGGTILNVSYAIALGSAISIPAAYVWGKIIDIHKRRKTQILVSFVGLSICLAGFLLTNNVLEVTLVYVVLNFMDTASGTPLSLLIMERSPKSKWSAAFSKMLMISSAGATVGLVIATVITGFVPLRSLIIALFLISLFSILLTARLLYEPAIRLSKKRTIDGAIDMFSEVFVHPLSQLIAKISKSKIKGMFQAKYGSGKVQRYIMVFYIASFVSFLSNGFFQTVFPAGLKLSGLTESNVFLVLFIGLLVQTAGFNYSGWFLKKGSKTKMVVQSSVLRGLCYIVIGVAFYATTASLLGVGVTFIAINAIFYAVGGGLAYAITYTASNVLFYEHIEKLQNQGSALGIYATVTGGGALLGAFLTGYSSYYIGGWSSPIIAGLLMLMSAYMFMTLQDK